MMTHRAFTAVLAFLLFGGGGCAVTGEGTTRPTRFYVLHILDDTAGDAAQEPRREDLTVAVGPVQLAAYLKRPHIVTHSEGNEVKLADFDRWAEPLEDGVTRVIAENLSLLLGTHRVVAHVPRSLAQPLYTMAIKVVRFDGRLGREALLSARWGVIERTSNVVLLTRRSHYRRPVEGSGYDALIAAENRILEDFCREIAETLRDLP